MRIPFELFPYSIISLQVEENNCSLDFQSPSNLARQVAVEDNSVHMKDKKKDIKKKMEDEQDRITKAVANLTIDAEKKVDHKSVLEDAARRLNEARLKSLDVEEAHIGDDLKTKINACETDKDLSKLLWAQPGFQSGFSSFFSSKL